MESEFDEVVTHLVQTIIDDEWAADYSHAQACLALNIDPEDEIGGPNLPESDPRYAKYYELTAETLQELLTSVKANLTNPPATGTDITNIEVGHDILQHYTKWLEANGIIAKTVFRGTGMRGDTEEENIAEVVSRYIELQWQEDREAEWGHAFDPNYNQEVIDK